MKIGTFESSLAGAGGELDAASDGCDGVGVMGDGQYSGQEGRRRIIDQISDPVQSDRESYRLTLFASATDGDIAPHLTNNTASCRSVTTVE